MPTPPPPPAFLPKINLPSIIPVKPTQPAAVKRPIPPFPPIINLPSIIPVKPTSAPKIQVKPATPVVVAPPAPFIPQKSLPVKPVTPKIIEKSLNDYLPPKEDEPEDEWTEWKVTITNPTHFNQLNEIIHVFIQKYRENLTSNMTAKKKTIIVVRFSKKTSVKLICIMKSIVRVV